MIQNISVSPEAQVVDSDESVQYYKDYCLSGNAILNKPDNHHTAAIAHRLNFTARARYNKIKKKVEAVSSEIEGSIWISDCNRSINLALSSYSPSESENGLYKLDTLIKELKNCRKNYKQMVKEKKGHDESFQEVFKDVVMDKVTSDFEKFKGEVLN